jgi:hypothetical protein
MRNEQSRRAAVFWREILVVEPEGDPCLVSLWARTLIPADGASGSWVQAERGA